MRRIQIALLPVAVVVALIFLWGANSTTGSQDDKKPSDLAASAISETEDSDTTTTAPEVISYYFHTTYRCASCKKIEVYSREAIERGFAEELESGDLKFESINIDRAENRHFIKDYRLYTKSLVICNMKDGKQVEWKNLARVWQLIRNKNEFFNYVQDEINAYLKEN